MILVLGATGSVGSHLVSLLSNAGENVCAVSRHPDPDHFPAAVESCYADLTKPDTLASVLDGVDAVHLLQGDYPSDEVVAAIGKAGVGRVVFLSALAVSTRPDSILARTHQQTEQALAGSDLAVTVLRPGQFASNVLQWRDMIEGGTVYLRHPDLTVPAIDPYDIAAVAAAVLTDTDPERHAGRTYPLTGPAISGRQQVGILAEVLERRLDVVELSAAQAEAQIRRSAPPHLVDALLELITEPSDTERRELTTVSELLGRPARDFSTWARNNRSAFTASW